MTAAPDALNSGLGLAGVEGVMERRWRGIRYAGFNEGE